MGARITELVLRRESALSLLKRAPHDSYVMAAIEVLENETAPGQPGGRAREFHENVGFLPASKDRVKKLPLRAQSGAVEDRRDAVPQRRHGQDAPQPHAASVQAQEPS